MTIEVRNSVELPANREPIELHTADGETLIGELATPLAGQPVATLICLHPLPTHGGFMDSHVMRKASNRLPALANIAVLRFNTRGTKSPQGQSTGSFDGGNAERFDVQAAVEFAKARNLPNLWLLGWSFGTELALKYGPDHDVLGAILLSPPLHRTSDAELDRWNHSKQQLVALIPEHDDYLKPHEAKVRFSGIPHLNQIDVEDARHLWVGETSVKRVLNEIVKVIAPSAFPLPETY
ncbi:MAG: alpha/beta hydrolase [Micrococcales bacterium]